MRTRRRLAGAVVSTVLLVGVLFVAGFPLRTYLAQRASTHTAVIELQKVQAEQRAVDAARQRLATAQEIERRAREQFGFVKPGEQAYNILPARSASIGLPDGWPFTGVEQVLRGP